MEIGTNTSEWTAELDVMKTIADALASLPEGAPRARVIHWACEYFGANTAVPCPWAGPNGPAAPASCGDQQLEIPTAEELYDLAAAPQDRTPNEDDVELDETDEDPVVHCLEVDALSIGGDIFEDLPATAAHDALIFDAAEIEAPPFELMLDAADLDLDEPPLVSAMSEPRSERSERSELDLMLRGFAADLQRFVNEFQAEIASTARLCSVGM